MRVERYQRQVAEGQTPSAFLRSYDTGHTAGQIGAAWGQVGGALEKWGAWAQKRQDEWDAATVMNAQTEFARRMSDYLDNPETGQTITRKLGNARDLTKDTDSYADQVAQEIAGRLENDRQRAVFNSGIPKAKMPFARQASDYEARELQAFRKQAFDANIAAAQDMYLRAADSPADRARAVDMAANAIRSQYFGAPEEYINLAIAETKSGMAAQWVAHVAQDNPLAAMEMLKDDSLGLLPETKDKLAAQIRPRAEIYEVQELAEALFGKYGANGEKEALQEVRRNYSGEKENRLAAMVKTLYQENDIDENKERRLRGLMWEDNYRKVLTQYLETGKWPDEETTRLMVLNGEISPEVGVRIKDNREAAAMQSGIERDLARTPGWSTTSPEKQFEMKAKAYGITKPQREAALAVLQERLIDPQYSVEQNDMDIEAYKNAWLISPAEAERLKNWNKKKTPEQEGLCNLQEKKLEQSIDRLNWGDSTARTSAKSYAKTVFKTALSELDPLDKDFRAKVMQARTDALVAAVEQSGKKRNDYSWWQFGGVFGEEGPTKFGAAVDKQLAAIQTEIDELNKTPYERPKFTPDKVDLPEKREVPKPANGTGKKIVGKTSYNELRDVVDNYAATYGVDPALIRAMIQVESAWNTKAVSGKNARGLMQIIPSTAKRFGVTDVFDAEQSIRGGTQYMAFLLKRYNGDIEKAVGAYNCGEGRMDKVIAGKKEMPKETVKYVPMVMAWYNRYKKETPKAQPQPPATPEQPAPQAATPGGKSSIDYIFRNGVPDGWRGGRMF